MLHTPKSNKLATTCCVSQIRICPIHTGYNIIFNIYNIHYLTKCTETTTNTTNFTELQKWTPYALINVQLTLILLMWRYGELLIRQVNGRWDLTRRLKD